LCQLDLYHTGFSILHIQQLLQQLQPFRPCNLGNHSLKDGNIKAEQVQPASVVLLEKTF
jgi:hypothetical protein